MIDSRSKRWIRTVSAIRLTTSIKASNSSSWRSLIARCNARERRQRLCSVMMSDLPEAGLASANGLASLAAPCLDAALKYLKLQILAFAQNAIGIFALHKCGL